MALKLITPDQPIKLANLKVLIYGEPGVGKTSLASTAGNTLIIDTDNGAHRSHFRGTVLKVDSWADIMDVFSKENAAEIAAFDTIILDTVGTAMKYLTADIIANSTTKYGAKKPTDYVYNNALSLKGFGVVKAQMEVLFDRLNFLRKDLIFIAHERSEDTKRVPAISGGTFDIITSNCDLVAYYNIEGGKRVIEFTPTDTHFGKDAAGLGKFEVPDFNTNPLFMGTILDKAKGNIGQVNERAVLRVAALKDLLSEINSLDNVEAVNAMIAHLKTINDRSTLAAARTAFADKVTTLGLTFDKETNAYVKN